MRKFREYAPMPRVCEPIPDSTPYDIATTDHEHRLWMSPLCEYYALYNFRYESPK